MTQIYEGKAKKVFATENPNEVVVSYKDDATADNGLKKGLIRGKGVVNNKVSNHLMKLLKSKNIPTHFIKELNDTDSLVKKVEIIPLEVIIRNVAAGSLSKRLGIPEGTPLSPVVLEFCYKDDSLGDPLVNEYHIAALGAATPAEIKLISDYSFKINIFLLNYLKTANINLIDFKLEFGRTHGEIILADEISPDTCRFWDLTTGKKLDKDLFRRDLGGVEEAYAEVLERLLGK